MSAPQPSLSMTAFAIRTALRVAAWVRQRPFVLSPASWKGLVGLALVLAGVVALATSAPWWIPAALCAVAAVGVIPLISWVRASRSDGRKVVFVARFADENPAHSSIATVHLKEVERRLLKNELLRRSFDTRFLKAPLKEAHAERLLKHTDAVTVISGSGLLVEGHARWEGWVLQRWPQTSGLFEPGESGEGLIRMFSAQLSAVRRSTTRTDAEYPVRKLTTDIFSAEHTDDIEGVLLVAAAAFAQTDADEALAIEAADALHGKLPVEASAVLEIGKAMRTLRETDDAAAAARQLEAAGDGGSDHIYLWNSCVALWTRAEQQDLSSGADRVRVAEKGLAVAPDDFFAQTGAGYGHMALEEPAKAIPYLERAVSNPERLDEQLLRQDLTVAYQGAGDLDKAREEARREYEEWPTSMRRLILRANRMTEEEYLADPMAHADEEHGAAADFTDIEADAVARAVRAVVDGDHAALEEMGAFEDGRDPYAWIRDHPLHEEKQLAMPLPAKDPRQWIGQLRRRNDGSCAVDVWMSWDDGELSPYALQLDLVPEPDGRVKAVFVELQIL